MNLIIGFGSCFHRYHRRGLRLGGAMMAVGAVIATAALVLWPADSGAGAILVHNEDRYAAHELELLVPKSSRASCDLAPEVRIPASQYCVWRRLHLEPRTRAWVKLPSRPAGCPLVWARRMDGQSQAVFALPAGIEIERMGRLDQKGIGAPQMHGAPEDATPLGSAGLEECQPGGAP
jgi:hypothetical protein